MVCTLSSSILFLFYKLLFVEFSISYTTIILNKCDKPNLGHKIQIHKIEFIIEFNEPQQHFFKKGFH